jgi:hypothetical protein
MARTTERVPFRLFRMPCCNHHLCWVNPRLPSFCPECGEKCYMKLRTDGSHTLVSDPQAMLKVNKEGA